VSYSDPLKRSALEENARSSTSSCRTLTGEDDTSYEPGGGAALVRLRLERAPVEPKGAHPGGDPRMPVISTTLYSGPGTQSFPVSTVCLGAREVIAIPLRLARWRFVPTTLSESNLFNWKQLCNYGMMVSLDGAYSALSKDGHWGRRSGVPGHSGAGACA
jgi:hypothetical protein